MAEELPLLSPPEVRILGCLMEKKEVTPDIYPMTANALLSAANQKTSRDPVMALEPADIHRTLKLLEQKGLVRQSFASRVERYEHLAAQKFSLAQAQIAILAMLMLRGPQTAYELLTRTERMARIGSIEALKSELDMLIGKRPPLIIEIPRGAGQREDRYMHLLAGEVDITAAAVPTRAAPSMSSELEERVRRLEDELAALKAKIEAAGF